MVLFFAMMGHAVGWITILKTAVGMAGIGVIGVLLGKWASNGK